MRRAAERALSGENSLDRASLDNLGIAREGLGGGILTTRSEMLTRYDER